MKKIWGSRKRDIPLFHLLCTERENTHFVVGALLAKLNSATAEKQCYKQNQATGIDAERKALHLATAAAQKQQDQEYPSAVAATHESAAATVVATATAVSAAVVVVATAAVAFVKHSVEHIYLHFAEAIGFSI